jgi:hypothetical protein
MRLHQHPLMQGMMHSMHCSCCSTTAPHPAHAGARQAIHVVYVYTCLPHTITSPADVILAPSSTDPWMTMQPPDSTRSFELTDLCIYVTYLL